MAATMAYLRANLCRGGSARMRLDSAAALEGLSPDESIPSDDVGTRRACPICSRVTSRTPTRCFAHAYDLAVSDDSAPPVMGSGPRRAEPGGHRAQ